MNEPCAPSKALSQRSETLLSRLDGVFLHAIAEKTFSGAALLVSDPVGILAEKTWGWTRWGGKALNQETRFDLASLTKALVTAPLFMVAASLRRLDLDDPIARFFPSGLIPDDKKPITIRHLLNHCSGLPPWEPFHLDLISMAPAQRKADLPSMILRRPLWARPGKASHYSDLGFLLLGMVLERVFGESIEDLASRYLFDPFEIDSLGYRKLNVAADPTVVPGEPDAAADDFVATEECPWRGRLLQGEVHDENAWVMGGVAPHAGLFGTARGVHRLLTRLHRIHTGRESLPELSTAVLCRFWERQRIVADSSWALGFDTPSATGSSSGKHFPPTGIGHLGFAGTSFWLDPGRGITIVLLTNRIHPTRRNEGLKTFRPLVHNLIMESLNEFK